MLRLTNRSATATMHVYVYVPMVGVENITVAFR